MTVQQRLSPGKYRLSVEDYRRLDESGAFGANRTELIEGDIIVMSPAYAPHAKLQARLVQSLVAALDDRRELALVVLAAPSVLLRDDTMPEPDVVIAEDHDRGPLPVDKVRLVIEISDTTLAWDLGDKKRLYGQAGVAEYWVVSINDRRIHQFWSPDGADYRSERIVAFGDALTPATLTDLTIATDRL